MVEQNYTLAALQVDVEDQVVLVVELLETNQVLQDNLLNPLNQETLVLMDLVTQVEQLMQHLVDEQVVVVELVQQDKTLFQMVQVLHTQVQEVEVV